MKELLNDQTNIPENLTKPQIKQLYKQAGFPNIQQILKKK